MANGDSSDELSERAMETAFTEDHFTFNVVFTPRTFRCLRYFLASLVVQSEVRFRIVANGCDADEILLMDRFMSIHATRVVEVLRLPVPQTVPHGEALTYTYDARPSGEFFCFVDSDIKARRKWMGTLIGELAPCAALTSGTVAWGADYMAPAKARWLTGDDFFATDGFVFGSPHVALYERAAVNLVRASWGVDFRGRPHSALPVNTQDAIGSLGRRYEMYDTGKLMNILLQLEGRCVRYVENDHLLHLGGISEYLANPLTGLRRNASASSLFTHSGQGRDRWEFSAAVAATLMRMIGDPDAPPMPEVTTAVARRVRELEPELVDIVERYREVV